MRVYEYAKEHGISSKDVLTKLKKNKIELANHMAVLSEDALVVLKGKKTESKDSLHKKTTSSAAKPKQAQRPSSAKTNSSAPKTSGGNKPAGPSKGATTNRPTNKPVNKNKKQQKKNTQKKTTTQQAPARDFRQSRETVVTHSSVDLIEVAPNTPLGNVAALMKKPPSELIFVLLKKGIVRNVNNTLSMDEVAILGQAFDVLIDEKKVTKKAVVKEEQKGTDERLPVVVVMGHVDHGKTTLLDYLRKANVAAREKGGITQHLGAYEVATGKGQNLVFLDTPGHEAFSYMRSRGTQVTDIAIIIIAANDGIKPQTVEAIQLAKGAGVPIVVAINKIDRLESESQLDTVRTQLAQHDLTPEEWGGETVCVPLSAKTGKGVDTLLEMLSLHAEMLDLKTKLDTPAHAFVLETKQIKGQGMAATVICSEGVLRRGDHFVCGQATGKVRLLIDSAGKQLKEVGPSVPVQVIGFDKTTDLGDYLKVVPQAEYNQAKNTKVFRQSMAAMMGQTNVSEDSKPGIRIICKTDMQGSAQAVIEAIGKMANSKRNHALRVELLSCDVGPISEGDVIRALDTGAMLFGLHVKAERNAQQLAKEKNLDIHTHGVIYHMFEQIEEIIRTERSKIVHLVEAGKAEVLKVFPVKNRRVIAGCMINEGMIKPGDKVVCIRKREEVGSGIVATLQRDKKEAKEVRAGNDCGFLTDTFHGWQPGDRIVIFSHERDED